MTQHFYRFLLIPILIFLSACSGTDATGSPSPTAASGATAPTATLSEEATTAPEDPTEANEEPAPTEPAEPTETTPATDVPTEEGTTPPATEAPVATPEPSATTVVEQPTGGDPTQVTLSIRPWLSGFTLPLGIVHAGDGSGRLFVIEKTGTIRVIQDDQILPDPLLNISNLVSNGSEQGLLGMAFEPNRPDRFYVNYTNLNGDTEVVRYTTLADNPNVGDPASAELLLEIQQPAGNHNGGNLVFGPDGYLWIGTGDGGAADDRYGNGQNYNALLGSMLRLDVSGDTGYTIPADNPFAGGDDGAPAIWAKGLRNPWRYSFDRVTGDLWIADVGQNQYEEVNRVSSTEADLNYGWPLMEATHCYLSNDCSNLDVILPVTEYDHNFGCSITGGYVYRGEQYPILQGIYVFGDYCSGIYWGVSATAESFTDPTELLQSQARPMAIGEDEAGELYVAGVDGVIYQVVAE
jgi:glucose/arabinose dehydrogenase